MDHHTITALLVLLQLNYMYASNAGRQAQLDPVNPVVRLGEKVMLSCTSPANYTGHKFNLNHNGSNIPGHSFSEADYSTDDYMYFIKNYELHIKRQQDAGVYTCLISTSNIEMNVNVSTNVTIINADGMTKFGVVGEETDMSCLGADVDDDLTFIWKVDGEMQPVGQDYKIKITEKDDAFKKYICRLISKKALDVYGNNSVANKAKAKGVEVEVTLSVIEIHKDCSGSDACSFKALVYGVAQVDIGWWYEGELITPQLNYTNNVTMSTTPLLNFTSTSSIQLTITDRVYKNSFSRNITRDSKDSAPSSNELAIVLGAVFGSLALLCAIIVVVLRKKGYICRGNSRHTPDETVLQLQQLSPEVTNREANNDDDDDAP